MNKVLHCDCGFEVRGAHEDALVAEVQRHALDAHGMALSHEEALVLTFRAELGQEASEATPLPGDNSGARVSRREVKEGR